MWRLPEGTVDDWKQQFADPENPTFEELRALGLAFTKPGKQCSHPVNSWFRDPRPNPPPLRSRKTLLTQIFREHTAFDGRCKAMLENYTSAAGSSDDSPTSAEVDLPAFPQFSLLPLEIREYIWQLAIPSRVLDVREIRHDREYTCIRSAVLPVPYIAHVCREARDVVMRLGSRIQLAWQEAPRSKSSLQLSPAGFFMKGIDVVLHMPDPSSIGEPQLSGDPAVQIGNDGVPVLNLVASAIAPTMRCDTMAVNWAPPARQPNARGYPGSTLPQPWVALRKAGPGVRTVYVYYRSRFIEVSLGVTAEFVKLSSDDWDHDVEVQLLVDLHDHQRLAELSSLETVLEDQKIDLPRYAGFAARNPGLCTLCERVQWEQYVEPAVKSQYLQLYEEELDDETYRAVFPPDAPNGYDPQHPWVKEKLKTAPQFRPAVLIHLAPAPVTVADDKADREDEEADYRRRVVALR